MKKNDARRGKKWKFNVSDERGDELKGGGYEL